MSFILEALNKAEEDRGTPTGHSVTLPQPIETNSKHQWVSIFLISITGSALVLGAFLALQHTGVFFTEPQAISAPPAADGLKKKAPVQARTETPNRPTRVPSAGHQPLKTFPAPKAVAVKPHIAAENKENSAYAAPSLRAMVNQQNKAPKSARNELAPSGEYVAMRKEQAVTAAKPAAGRVEYPPEIEEPPSPIRHKNAPLINNLPKSIRTRLPALELNVHVFSDNPAKRFVYINSVRYGEGARIGGELTLEEITSTGVILNYHGNFFRIPLET